MAEDVWTFRRMLDWVSKYLEGKGDEHPRLSGEWLLSNVTGLTRVQIYMNLERRLTPDELHAMHDAVVRRAKGEPLQYVTGEMPFRHIVLRCERGVLIPRPETEILVDAALEGVDAAVARGQVWPNERKDATADQPEAAEPQAAEPQAAEPGEPQEERVGHAVSSFAGDPSHDAASADDDTDEKIDPIVHVEGPESSLREVYIPGPGEDVPADGAEAEPAPAAHEPEPLPSGPRVLEIGCGTGCISLSIAGERPGTHVVATDLSPQAVALAGRNRDALNLGDFVDVVQCDLASGVDPELMGTFSVLVSNPPYIPSAIVPTLPQEVVGFEPKLALDGGPDGLDVFRRILGLAPSALAPGGMLCCELFEENVTTAAELVLRQPGWASAEVREDLTHRPRVLVAVRQS